MAQQNTFANLERGELISLDNKVKENAVGDVYYIHVIGDSLRYIGVYNDDFLVIDRERLPEIGNLIIAQWKNNCIIYPFDGKKRNYTDDEDFKYIKIATVDGKVVDSKHKPLRSGKTILTYAVVTHILRNALIVR